MIGLIAFLWANWAWLGAVALVALAIVAYLALGRRPLAYGLTAVAALLLIYTAFGWADDWRTAIRAERDQEWQAELTRQRADAQSKQLAQSAADYQAGLAKAAELATAATADRAATETIIERVIHESPSADACRYDDSAAAASNGLRERPD